MGKEKIVVVILLIAIGLVLAYLLINQVLKQEPLIGGCAGVAPWYIQECCERTADEENIIKPACVGYWKVENSKCSWQCGTAQDNEQACLINGGKWVEKQIGGFLDLNVNSNEECKSWGGNCGARIISSFDIGKCDDNSACWMVDIWKPTCILQK